MQGLSILIIIGLIVFFKVRKNKAIGEFRDEYYLARKGDNRNDALIKGRRYYAKTRSGFLGIGFGKLTIYDEQAISNDLSTMK